MTTTHLTDSELVDLAEDTLDPRRAAHVETCEGCRAQGTALRVLLRDTAGVAVPEPSPLFWDHLSARVREGVAAESSPRRSAWEWSNLVRGFVPLAAAAAVIVVVISGVWLLRGVRSSEIALSSRAERGSGGASSKPGAQAGGALTEPGAPAGDASTEPGVLAGASAQPGAASAELVAAAVPDPDNSEVWNVLTTAASGVGLHEAHAAGMHVQPAALDHAVLDLSAAELTELGRLLQTEMKRASD